MTDKAVHPIHVHAWASSDVGCRRDHNEDSYLMAPELKLFVVADGMGGHAGGEMASTLAVRSIEAHVRSCHEAIAEDARHDASIEESPVAKVAADAVRAACAAVFGKAEAVRELRGMGTTATMLLFHHAHAFIGHVGDTRAYLVRDGKILQLSEDHSLVNEQVKAGLITEAQARTSRFKNIITRSVGFDRDVEVDVIAVEVKPRDAFLLCSDGLSNLVQDAEICSVIGDDFLHAVPRRLIEMANSRGGDDNSTVIVAYVCDDAEGGWHDEIDFPGTVTGGAAHSHNQT